MAKKSEIKAVISDLVGVYSKDGTTLFMGALHDRYGISPSAVDFFRQRRREATTNGATIDAVLEQCQKEWNTTYDAANLTNLWISFYEPIDATVNLYKRLRSSGIKLALLTNNVLGIVEHVDKLLEERYNNEGLESRFDVVVASYVMGVRKPQEEIYREAFNGLGVNPENAVFVDDKVENLGPAEALGMIPLLFVNPQKLEADFISLGIQFPARGIPAL